MVHQVNKVNGYIINDEEAMKYWGREYEKGASVRGFWGLYGSYDYIAPQIFRVSSTIFISSEV